MIRANNAVERLDATGIILGALPDAKYEVRMIEFHHGDTLILYTDGVTETRNSHGEEFGLERLAAEYIRNREMDAGALVWKITRDVRKFCAPEPVKDDLTLIAVRLPSA
jgi:sigma-B regulation protein RsbU (phosphoserine phosphatase)